MVIDSFIAVQAVTMDPVVSFIRSLEIEERPALQDLASTLKSVNLDENKPQGLVDTGSLVSFTINVKGQQKEDVLNSTMLAQLAANKKFDRYNDTQHWYEFYLTVMQNIGWVMQKLDFGKINTSEDQFKISDVMMTLLADLIGGDKELLKVVKDTIDGLQKSGEGLSLFDSKSSSSNKGNFQIMPCTVDKGGQVIITFVGSYFSAKEESKNYFFFTRHKRDIDLFKASEVITLNETVYGQVRDEVKKKLGKHASDFVHNLDI